MTTVAVDPDEARLKAFRAAAASNRTVRLKRISRVVHVSSGVAWFDQILGGGLPLGRLVEIYGEDRACKSMTAWQVVAKRLAEGWYVVWFGFGPDSVDPSLAELCGVDPNHERLHIVNPELGAEEGLEVVRQLAPFAHLTVIDSVAALVTDHQLGQKVGMTTGYMARIFNDFLLKVAGPIMGNGNVLLLLNQLRDKPTPDGEGRGTSTGGRRRLHDAWARIRLRLVPLPDGSDGPQLVEARAEKRRGTGPGVVRFRQDTLAVVDGGTTNGSQPRHEQTAGNGSGPVGRLATAQ